MSAICGQELLKFYQNRTSSVNTENAVLDLINIEFSSTVSYQFREKLLRCVGGQVNQFALEVNFNRFRESV